MHHPPMLPHFSEALSYKHCRLYQQKSEWYASSRRVPLYVCIYIKVFLLCFPHQLRRTALFRSEINDFCAARHSFSRKSMIFALHDTLLLGNQ
ncbi:hypothetical protein HMPREF0658_2284 [Hoylesella marshii DSM 16973 = JCM 13450]|uniref:Uncharacterized protein n=1 Tax=Hoylesella marshii DSM 16973 = JCM 13450 TaxID=862515 RepID=E0NVS9_9BACT|nr:hypothetical protein HMPREF0658_2284 [Hoylesella marshii DSM 16973 = JCM 13450]